MLRMPKIGERVVYVGSWEKMRGVVGVVTKQYPGYIHRDADGTVRVHDSVAVKPDVLPEGWPYPEHDTFAPQVSELRLDPARLNRKRA